ncbi:hypothetical protein P43SY_002146 [Pythium insidiosum]|uniref:Uncharacterized protein n=1 Tax=Pythium insidiosum TaxID=114742 RepID=A0AAD5M0Y2_PYTIN|nr:hypothetical protein P43SY_002146 [Pythium insidiosum]
MKKVKEARRRSLAAVLERLQLRAEPFEVELGDRGFRLLWFSVVSFHAIHALAYLYQFLELTKTMTFEDWTLYLRRRFGHTEPFQGGVRKFVAYTSIVFALLHLLSTYRVVRTSVACRQLAFLPPATARKQISPNTDKEKPTTTRLASLRNVSESARRSRPYTFLVKLTLFWTSLTAPSSPYFETMFNARKIVEISAQIFQVYHVFTRISTRWATNTALLVVILNCWIAPLIRLVWRSNTRMSRVLSLVSEIWLASFFTILVPFLTYLLYLEKLTLFDDIRCWGDPVWIIEIGNLLKLLSIPLVGTFLRQKFIDVVFVLLGVFVIVLHMRSMTTPHAIWAARQSSLSTCVLPIMPWFAEGYSCAVLKIQCDNAAVGSRSQIEGALTDVLPESVQALIIRDCPSLEMPSGIQRLRQLVYLEVANSTLHEWSDEAALTAEYHRSLAHVLLLQMTNVSSLPDAISGAPISTLIVHTSDLAALPQAVAWHDPMDVLLIERSALTGIPTLLLSTRANMLSLAGNHIVEVPSGFLPYFETVFNTRKVVEIAAQILQLYNIFSRISARWATDSAVLVVILNCWLPPLIRYLWRSDARTSRLLSLLSDIWMASFFTILVPYITYRLYLEKLEMFDDLECWANPVWVINTGNLLHLLLVNAWLPALSTRFAAVTMLLGLELVKSIVTRASGGTSTGIFAATESTKDHSLCRVPVPSPIEWSLATFVIVLHMRSMTTPHAIWAARQSSLSTCVLPIMPWFAEGYSCAVLKIQCDNAAVGSRSQIEGALTDVLPESVQALIIRDCPSLEMPSGIQRLRQLVYLEVANSTLHEWSDEAALTAEYHRSLAHVLLLQMTNVSSLPDAISGAPISTLIVHTSDLAALPQAVAWHDPMDVLLIERSALTGIPTLLLSTRANMLSLAGNHIVEVPSGFLYPVGLGEQRWSLLALSNNPIASWPADEGRSFSATRLYVHGTAISSLPGGWVQGPRLLRIHEAGVWASGTPLCDAPGNPNGTLSLSNEERELLHCAVDVELVAFLTPFDWLARARVSSAPFVEQ